MERLPPDTITEREIVSFQENGAICLREVFSKRWIDLLRKGIEHNRLHPSENTKRKGHLPLFFHDYDNWKDIPEYKEFLLNSPVGEVAGRLSRSAVRQIASSSLSPLQPRSKYISRIYRSWRVLMRVHPAYLFEFT